MDTYRTQGRLLSLYVLRLLLPIEDAEDTAVFFEELVERLRSEGRSIPTACLSCVVQAICIVFAYRWKCFASRPERVLAGGNIVIANSERFTLYRGQAACGALFGTVVLWVMDRTELINHRPGVFDTKDDIHVACVIVGLLVAWMICRTAFKRGEFLPLAVLYVAAYGAIVGSFVGVLPLMTTAWLIVPTPKGLDLLENYFFVGSMVTGAALNLYAKFWCYEPAS